MQLYYTTTAGEDIEQKYPNNSLGGYKSSTLVPNEKLNNLFGDISAYSIKNADRSQYIALMLRNTTGVAITNISFWFEYSESCYSKWEVASVIPTVDSVDVMRIENVDTVFSRPFTGDFYESDGEDNYLSLGDLAIDGMLGIWLKRTIQKDVVVADWSSRIVQEGNVYVENELSTIDEVQIKISW